VGGTAGTVLQLAALTAPHGVAQLNHAAWRRLPVLPNRARPELRGLARGWARRNSKAARETPLPVESHYALGTI
jgi:hypothetical protein